MSPAGADGEVDFGKGLEVASVDSAGDWSDIFGDAGEKLQAAVLSARMIAKHMEKRVDQLVFFIFSTPHFGWGSSF